MFSLALSRRNAFSTVILFFFAAASVTIFRSWVRSKQYAHKYDAVDWKIADLDSRLPTNEHRRIEHISDDLTTADHCVFYNFLRSTDTETTDHEPITLALHSTINYAEHVIKHAENWDDVLSYAIFLFPRHDEALQALAMLHKCHDTVNRKVSIHLVWNRNFLIESCVSDNIVKNIATIPESLGSCDDFDIESFVEKLKEVKVPFGSYPINVMRNEARRGAATKLHIIGDIETQYSPAFAVNVRPLAQQLLNGYLGKAVLVYRRFELDENEKFPTNLRRFSNLLADKKIVQFHVKHYRVGHFIPNLQHWLQYSLNNDEVTFDNVSYISSEWEPQFIMRHDAPYHYEHVPTRMTDHQFLCYELCRAGYSYLLMTHVYNIHPGIKDGATPLEKSLGIYGLAQTDPTMRKFRAYINARYPIYQKSRCPNWKNYL
uniref:N-acetyllactosaminide beta-1,3-N-acetylglucosaminyltransferase n=1 Tax=Panagrellus redivivus TaxID=6233 RepID=A0A7E4VKB2_PANRE